ncbi:MAG: fibrobacter succinogenes major paralogous domain-containing protein [Bacteroidia bacterium]|nr:fibrobacter succinogenes major paralogous domain-containing protein [Bacteroidia bacterium]
MKKTFFISFLSTIFCINVFSQTYNHCQGDSVHLGIASYTGSLQWQQSSDSLNWSDIIGATFSPYGFVFSTPKYYRAKISAPNCNPVYSPVKKTVSNANCPPTFPQGSIFCSGPTAIVEVTNPATGKIWMDRNLGASQVATSSTDANSYGDLYQWGRRSDGHQCRTSSTITTLSSTDQSANGNFILAPNVPFDWRSPQNVNLWQGLYGINNPCPSAYRLPTETELDAERLSWSANTSAGAFASPLKLTMAGARNFSNGSLGGVGAGGYYWSNTVSGTDSRRLYFAVSTADMSFNYRAGGRSVRCIKEPGSVGALNCGSSTLVGNLISGQAANNVTANVPYTGGNGSYYAAQTITSTGVTGLTASLSSGNFASGNGSLTYSINGTPAAIGTVSFVINIGGQSCTLNFSVATLASMYPAGSVFCSGPTAIVDVTNPATGKIWMDRNLGAAQTATSSTDANAYGDLYQWGRGSDGHQCRNSSATSILSSTDQPTNGNFILTSSIPNDWRNPQNSNLWQGVNGLNNPCPSGYRLPTDAELDAQERPSWNFNNSAGAFNSPLKWTVSGYRNFSSGTLLNVGSSGYCWSSTIASMGATYLVFNSSSGSNASNNRANGNSVRCIKD